MSYGTATFNTAEVDDLFNRLNSTFISKGIPVVMGEWASTNKNNLSERVKHAQYYVAKAKAVKIPTLWWDNNNATANTGDAMGLLNRSNNTWYFSNHRERDHERQPLVAGSGRLRDRGLAFLGGVQPGATRLAQDLL